MRLIKTLFESANVGQKSEGIYLGKWCISSANSESLLAPTNPVLHYHWDDRDKYHNDYIELSGVYEKALASLVGSLNNIHHINRDIDYWRIIVGPWLRFFIDAVFDRYECIRYASENRLELTFHTFSYDLSEWCPEDFPMFWDYLTSEKWNEVVFSECIKFQKIRHEELQEKIFPNLIKNKNPCSAVSLFKKGLKWASSKYSEIIGSNYNGVVIIGAYAPAKTLIKLYLSLSQIPLLSLPRFVKKGSKINKLVRETVCASKNLSGFEGFVNSLVPTLIPRIYIEDFSKIRTGVLAKYPKNPEAIFTANLYQSDDRFKIWAAEKRAEGVPLILGQHGGTFGIARHNQTVDHQLRISDEFVSWGWDDDNFDSIIKLPSMQLSDRKNIVPCEGGDILLVQTSLPRYFYCHYSVPVAGQFLDYLKDQVCFLNELEPVLLDILHIRLDQTRPSRAWAVENFFGEAGYSDKIDNTDQTLFECLEKCRVCVSTSNSTVFLETLALNFPTVVFWDQKYNEVSLDAQPYIDAMVKAKILFYDPAKAAMHLNNLGENIDGWWFSEEVQTVRMKVCDRYAYTSNDWLSQWRDFLLLKKGDK